jgi:hypothetical protein
MTLSFRFSLLILATAWTATAAIPMTVRQGRPVVDGVYVNGHGPFRFLLDTGAQSSQLDVRVAREIGLVATYQVELAAAGGVRRVAGVEGVPIRVGEAEAAGEVLLTGMDGVREWAPDVRGVLGQSFLGRFDFRLDFRGGRMEFGRMERLGLRAELELISGRPAVFTSLGRLVIDSGADRVILFSQRRGVAAMVRTAGGVAAAGRGSRAPFFIEGRAFRADEIFALGRPAHMKEDGLLPANLFAAIYFCNSGRYLVLE